MRNHAPLHRCTHNVLLGLVSNITWFRKRFCAVALPNDSHLLFAVFLRVQPSWFSGFLVDGGLTIVSRFPIVSSDQVTFGKGATVFFFLFAWPGRLLSTPRAGLHSDQLAAKGALYALVELPVEESEPDGAPLRMHVFCTHLQSSYNPHEGLSTAAFLATRAVRERQLGVLRRFIEAHMADDYHDGILLGDLNINARPHTHGDVVSERRDAGDPLAPLLEPDRAFTTSSEYGAMLDTLASPLYLLYDTLRHAAQSAGLTSHPVTRRSLLLPLLLRRATHHAQLATCTCTRGAWRRASSC